MEEGSKPQVIRPSTSWKASSASTGLSVRSPFWTCGAGTVSVLTKHAFTLSDEK